MATGQCYLEGKQLIVYPFTFYHSVHFYVYSPTSTRKATKDRTLVAIFLWIKELTEYLYQ